MFDLLDSLIATVTVVLVLSLIVQSVQQILKQLLNMKSKFMERELFAMFAHVTYKRTVVPVKFQFDKLASRYPDIKDLVDKISGRMSGVGYDDLAMVESLTKDKFLKVIGDVLDTGELEVKEKNAAKADEKSHLNEQIDFLQKARSDIEQWYDTTLKSFQDHYERRMKMWAFGMSAIVVVWLNQNIFDVYREFSHNQVLTATVTKLGERLLDTRSDTTTSTGDSTKTIKTVVARIPPVDTIRTQLARIDSLINNGSFNLMRWDKAPGWPQHATSISAYLSWGWNVFWGNVFGWLGMTLLVGLGAPFWYDLLKTLMGVKDRLRGERTSPKENTPINSAPANPAEPPAHG